MRISFHGGMCCGIKHIFELGKCPTIIREPLEKIGNGKPCIYDVTYDWCRQDERFFREEAPAETGDKRLDRYLEYLQEHRPGGIVEITLVTPGKGWWSQEAWVPVLVERGFVEVTPEGGVYNSNSGNKVRVFHLYMKDE